MDQDTRKRLPLQLFLFLLTLVATTLAGAEWRFGHYPLFDVELIDKETIDIYWTALDWDKFATGFAFSIPFLMFLTVHEFGHYITARLHKIKVTLPYYIPLWLNVLAPIVNGLLPSIGTMGAVIRIREYIQSKKIHFDIGIAGPLAGFVVALGVLFWGFTHLPPQEYLLEVHPAYEEVGPNWQEKAFDKSTEGAEPGQVYLGKNLLFLFFENYVATQPERVPNALEVIHYPWLFAGYLALFFTALNLLPIGQLDGGHILYGLVGYKWHGRVATMLFVALVFWAGLGIPTPDPELGGQMLLNLLIYGFFLYYLFGRMHLSTTGRLILALSVLLGQLLVSYMIPGVNGYTGWLLFSFLIGRFLGIYHPRSPIEEPLSTGRKMLGWLALVIFILCFSPEPFVVVQ